MFANPVIIAEEEAKKVIIEAFELDDEKDKISWIADNSKHYSFVVDSMDGGFLDDDED